MHLRERETAVISTHPLKHTREEVRLCRLWPRQAVWERAHEALGDPCSVGSVVLETHSSSMHGANFTSCSVVHGGL